MNWIFEPQNEKIDNPNDIKPEPRFCVADCNLCMIYMGNENKNCWIF